MSDAASGRRRDDSGASEERLEILRLLQAGEITTDEAAQLLDALARSEGSPRGRASDADPNGRPMRKGASFRVRVTNNATGKANVNLSLPLGLVGAGMAVARRFAPDHIPDADTVNDALAAGLRGKIIDVNDDGEHVEIWVE